MAALARPRLAGLALALLGLAASASAGAADAGRAPGAAGAAAPPGHYGAQLCVATRPGVAPGCGAAEADVRAGGRLDVRVSDIVYRLTLRSAELDVSTLHGRLQIDEFSAAYEWQGEVLRFEDAAKGVRYEVRLGARQSPR